MKQPTKRIHRNGATKQHSAQSKIHGSKKIKAKAVQETVSLLFVGEESGSIGRGIDLDPTELVAIEKDAAARWESLDAWLLRTLNETPALRTLHSTAQQPAAQGTIAAKAQSSLAEKQVQIILYKEDGECFGNFELPESAFLAMKADAEVKGISLTQWMINAVEAKFGSSPMNYIGEEKRPKSMKGKSNESLT